MEIEMQTSSNRARALPMPGVAASGRLWIVVLAALLTLVASLSARAQPAGDPPSRAARLSEVDGQVWLYSTDSDEWIPVARNRPLTTGDRIATDNGARAEITLGTTTLRLDAATELEDRSPRRHALQRAAARRQRRGAPAQRAIAGRVRDAHRRRALPRPGGGRYRFDRFDQTSDVTVFTGQAIYEARNTALPVTAGQHVQFWLDNAGVPQYATVAPARDAFAGWNDDRDRAEDRIVTASTTRYVSPEMTGAEDLDRYGQWQQTPEYGALWVPRAVGPDWAPYATATGPGSPVGLDLGRRRALGLRALPLRPLGLPRNPWCWAPGTRTSPARSMRRRWWRGSAAATSVSISSAAARGRLVPARAARGLRAVVPRQPALRAAGQRHACHQRHQHHDDRQQPQRRSGPTRFRQPQVRPCGDVRSCRCDDATPACGACRSALSQ